MDVGILSATQGGYHPSQLLLDIGQGARIASSAYPHADSADALARPRRRDRGMGPGPLEGSGRAAAADPRAARLHRARRRRVRRCDRPGTRSPPPPRPTGGVAWPRSRSALPRPCGGGSRSCSEHTAWSSPTSPPARRGAAHCWGCSPARAPGELLIAVQRSGEGTKGELLWAAAAGLGGGRQRELTSATTQEPGLLAAVDLAPTVLAWTGAKVPAEVRGRRIEAAGALDGAALRGLIARLRVIGGRRLKAFGLLLCAWALVLLAAAASRRPALVARALRGGAVGVLFAPLVSMASRRARAVGRRRVRGDRRRLPRARRCHRRARAVAARAGRARARDRGRDRRRRARARAADDALAARTRPDHRLALLRRRQRAEVGARGAGARRGRGGALSLAARRPRRSPR